jgi:EAL domain-containing protein (putative c-di-GMP-specific phosphodiesterase class I)
VAETIAKLDSIGVGFALDDFGTGYSSIEHLRKFTFRSLKIDRSFVAGLPADSKSAASRAGTTLRSAAKKAGVAVKKAAKNKNVQRAAAAVVAAGVVVAATVAARKRR